MIRTVFSRVLRDSTPRFVRPSVGWLGGPHFTFFMFLRSLASLLLAKCFSNSNTAPAHPHATEVAVYPTLFLVACYGTLHPTKSLCLLVGWSILISFSFMFLPKCSNNSDAAPAHSHATGVAVYLALLKTKMSQFNS